MEISADALDQERMDAVLRKRAKKLSREFLKESADEEDLLEIVEFRLGQERYGVASLHVGEVIPLRERAVLPCTPPFVAGILNLRGRIVSLIDLKFFFDIPATEISKETRVIVLRSGEMELGILADALVGIRMISLRNIHPPLPTMEGVRSAYLLGVEGEDTALLDGGRILKDESLIVNEEV